MNARLAGDRLADRLGGFIRRRDARLVIPAAVALALSAVGAPSGLRVIAFVVFVLVSPGTAALRLARLELDAPTHWCVAALIGWTASTLLSLASAAVHWWQPWVVFAIEGAFCVGVWWTTSAAAGAIEHADVHDDNTGSPLDPSDDPSLGREESDR